MVDFSHPIAAFLLKPVKETDMHMSLSNLVAIAVIAFFGVVGFAVLSFRRNARRRQQSAPAAEVAMPEVPKSDLEIRRDGLVIFGESLAACVKASRHYGSPSVSRAIRQAELCVYEAELAVETLPSIY